MNYCLGSCGRAGLPRVQGDVGGLPPAVRDPTGLHFQEKIVDFMKKFHEFSRNVVEQFLFN